MESSYAASMGRPTQRVELVAGEREALEGLRKRQRSARSLAFRAGIILGCATGVTDKEVAKQARTTSWTVGFWRQRFNRGRLEALSDEPRVGAPRSISDERVEEVITTTLESMPQNATHWSSRALAQRLGMSQSSISRIWRAFGLQPHRRKSFSLSQDPQLIEKVRDIVGLYMEPPVNAVVLWVDEKSQIQALARSQPLLPMRPGQVERRTHDDRRHGTTSLFAALEVATGNVLAKCYRRHRSVEFRDFLDRIDAAVPKDQEVHIVLDNYATHKTALVRNWLAKRPRYRLHFTPTHSRGSIRWNAGSLNSVRSRSSEAIITRSSNSKRPSKPSLRITTPRPDLSGGSSPPTRSSPQSLDLLDPPFYKKSMTQDTSAPNGRIRQSQQSRRRAQQSRRQPSISRSAYLVAHCRVPYAEAPLEPALFRVHYPWPEPLTIPCRFPDAFLAVPFWRLGRGLGRARSKRSDIVQNGAMPSLKM